MNEWMSRMFGGGQTMAGGPGGFGTPASNPELAGQAMGAKRIGGMEAPASSGCGGMGLAAGMESPGMMGLLGAGMGMMQASQQGDFGDAIGGGMGGLLGGAMTANQAKQSRLSDERFNGLLGGMTPGQQASPPMTGNPAQPPMAQGPSPSSMPPMQAGGSPMAPPSVAGMGAGDPYGGGRQISVGAPAPMRPGLPPQYGRRQMSPYGMAYGGV
jgi:hypothetical protein